MQNCNLSPEPIVGEFGREHTPYLYKNSHLEKNKRKIFYLSAFHAKMKNILICTNNFLFPEIQKYTISPVALRPGPICAKRNTRHIDLLSISSSTHDLSVYFDDHLAILPGGNIRLNIPTIDSLRFGCDCRVRWNIRSHSALFFKAGSEICEGSRVFSETVVRLGQIYPFSWGASHPEVFSYEMGWSS